MQNTDYKEVIGSIFTLVLIFGVIFLSCAM